MMIVIYYAVLDDCETAMPRVSREQTEQNRIRIEEVASRLFRERGFKGVTVADVMGAAGLTHGGFYGHFASKDALAAVACRQAFADSRGRWDKLTARHAEAPAAQAALIGHYLKNNGPQGNGVSCPAASLAVDVAREAPGTAVRAAYIDGLKNLLGKLEDVSGEADAQARREQALVQMATLVGAVTLAQATEGDPLSQQLIDAARRLLLED
jgi:TetR/AcrR family transcriptional repressor of nem operon